MTPQLGLQTITIHILPSISQTKRKQTMKFCQLIKYNQRNVFNKIFGFSHIIWDLGKWKRQKFKNSMFDSPLISNQTFLQTEFIFGKLDFAHINMHFHKTKC